MKSTLKFTSIFAAGLLLLSIYSCSKKEIPKPADSNPPVVVYNERNNGANYPTTGMAFDAAGNFYFASVGLNSIRMVTPSGVITTIAGSGKNGAANGNGTLASFNIPSGLAVDAANNIYVADAGNNLIRKITPDGTVTTLAGSGSIGSANGKGAAASFNFPQGVAVDVAGNVYVADTGNDLIRKITPDGTVTTLAGKVEAGNVNGTGRAATFNIPQGLVADADGNIYVADAGNNLIRKISPAGVVSTFAGSGQALSYDGTGTGVGFDFPCAIAIDQAGNLYVTEAYSNNICKILSSGLAYRLPVSGEAPFGTNNTTGIPNIDYTGYANTSSGVGLPNGIAVNIDDVVYVADYADDLIKQAVNH